MLGDDIADVLPELQAQAESMMRDRCHIKRITGVTPDPVTGADVETYADVYTGICKVQDSGGLAVQDEELPGSTAILLRPQVHIPVDAGPVKVGDVVDIIDDADLVLRTFRVAGLHKKTWQTAQRLPVEELS